MGKANHQLPRGSDDMSNRQGNLELEHFQDWYSAVRHKPAAPARDPSLARRACMHINPKNALEHLLPRLCEDRMDLAICGTEVLRDFSYAMHVTKLARAIFVEVHGIQAVIIWAGGS